SSSHVSTRNPRGPSAASMAGTWSASHLSPVETEQSCVLLQSLGITKARSGSLPEAMSVANSENGRSFVWFRFPKLVHGLCFRTSSPATRVEEPAEGRSSTYAFHVSPAASHAWPRFSALNGDPRGGHALSFTPRVLPAHRVR